MTRGRGTVDGPSNASGLRARIDSNRRGRTSKTQRFGRFRTAPSTSRVDARQAGTESRDQTRSRASAPAPAIDRREARGVVVICRSSQRITLLRIDGDPIADGVERPSDFIGTLPAGTTVAQSHALRNTPRLLGGLKPVERGHGWGHGWGRAGAAHRWGTYS